MPTFDPTYPLYPIACILSSTMLLLTLATSLVRQSWNLGVTFLCFWLFWENLTAGINAVVWSDNYDIKLYVYCDIVTRLEVTTSIVRPMCTLIIVRRLYLIASLRSVELPSSREKRHNMIIEWTLGLLIPLIVSGPLYYVVQGARFNILQDFGCQSASDSSILADLLLYSWPVIVPLISVFVYYPKVVWVFYRQRRDTNRFLHSSNSISHTNYFRILALASVDVLFTLPSGIANLVIFNLQNSEFYQGHVPFYNGWDLVHSEWGPVGYSYAKTKSVGAAALPQLYVSKWTSPILTLIIFGLFGLTAEARSTYWRAVCSIAQWLGWKPKSRISTERPTLGTMEFGARPQEISLDAELGSRPSFVNFERIVAANPTSVEDAEGEHTPKAIAESNPVGSVVDVGHGVDGTAVATPPHEQSEV